MNGTWRSSANLSEGKIGGRCATAEATRPIAAWTLIDPGFYAKIAGDACNVGVPAATPDKTAARFLPIIYREYRSHRSQSISSGLARTIARGRRSSLYEFHGSRRCFCLRPLRPSTIVYRSWTPSLSLATEHRNERMSFGRERSKKRNKLMGEKETGWEKPVKSIPLIRRSEFRFRSHSANGRVDLFEDDRYCFGDWSPIVNVKRWRFENVAQFLLKWISE